MLLVDRALEARANEGRPILYGILGAGFIARGVLNQDSHTEGMRCAAICNRTIETAMQIAQRAGAADPRYVDSVEKLDEVIAAGGTAITDDPAILSQSRLLECLVEMTGSVEYGARAALLAIENGKHMVLMNAEVDATVGPLLKKKADEAGVIITGCDGDQPAVEMNLYRFVRSIGLDPLVCGNIKGLLDYYRTPATQAGFAKSWGQSPAMVTSFADGTKVAFEQAVVANATGMKVPEGGMFGMEHHDQIDSMVSKYDIDELRAYGGIVDFVVGALPAPGVYVFAAARDAEQEHYLDYAKLGKGPLYSFYVPYHLMVFEVTLSVARVVEFGDAAISPLGAPVADVVAVAKTDMDPGHVIDGLGGFSTYGVGEDHQIVRRGNLLPVGLAEGAVLRRGVRRDEVLTRDDVEVQEDGLAWQLRLEQDRTFPVST